MVSQWLSSWELFQIDSESRWQSQSLHCYPPSTSPTVQNCQQWSKHSQGNTSHSSRPGMDETDETKYWCKMLYIHTCTHIPVLNTHLADVILSSKDINIQNKYSLTCVLCMGQSQRTLKYMIQGKCTLMYIVLFHLLWSGLFDTSQDQRESILQQLYCVVLKSCSTATYIVTQCTIKKCTQAPLQSIKIQQ